MINIYVVGDSTLASFKDSYYYPRYGYATKLNLFFNKDVNIINLAISGRSSKSYLKDKEYTYLKDNISKGDYLIIGFGHNDEKYDDPNRFTTCLDNSDKSFAYYLKTYYLDLARSKGATPILATPIVRADKTESYTNSFVHQTKYGDYRQTILDLGKQTNTTVIDLTKSTLELYKELGFNKAIYFHAWPKNKAETVDTTHLNEYGAEMVSYLFSINLKNTDSPLKEYLLKDLVKPSIDNLKPNKDYIDTPYKSFNSKDYVTHDFFGNIAGPDWYVTTFGDTNNPLNASAGFFAEHKDNTYTIGQNGIYLKGLIGKTEGLITLFKQVPKDDNFSISANLEVLDKKVDGETGFGLMLRDDIYLEQNIPDSSILSNYVSAGFYDDDTKTNIIYKRENKILIPSEYNTPYYKKGDKLKIKLERLGQVVNIIINYNNNSYTKTYTDFDFFAIDQNYFYLAFYATKGTVIKISNINYTYLGKSQGA